MGGVDCVVLSGGIGEKNPYMRERMLENLEFMGIKLDSARNKQVGGSQGLISADYAFDSKAKIYVIPTNEEMVVAYFTRRVVEEKRDLKPEEMQFSL
jgi:acetate kinase